MGSNCICEHGYKSTCPVHAVPAPAVQPPNRECGNCMLNEVAHPNQYCDKFDPVATVQSAEPPCGCGHSRDEHRGALFQVHCNKCDCEKYAAPPSADKVGGDKVEKILNANPIMSRSVAEHIARGWETENKVRQQMSADKGREEALDLREHDDEGGPELRVIEPQLVTRLRAAIYGATYGYKEKREKCFQILAELAAYTASKDEEIARAKEHRDAVISTSKQILQMLDERNIRIAELEREKNLAVAVMIETDKVKARLSAALDRACEQIINLHWRGFDYEWNSIPPTAASIRAALLNDVD